ncbi:tetratricopeptide repeat protein [Streptomyces sp. NPDC059474]|uniref:tetratricopeptide repeat protein n=1 Tax=unclassified Streptomyces TaxID=2593676 RepID=UPI0033EEC19E
MTTLTARLSYGDGLRQFGLYAEAETVARRVLADWIRLQGPDHPLALASLSLTARVAHGLGKVDEAIAALQELIERRERVLGPEHPFIAENRQWLAEWQAEAEAQP